MEVPRIGFHEKYTIVPFIWVQILELSYVPVPVLWLTTVPVLWLKKKHYRYNWIRMLKFFPNLSPDPSRLTRLNYTFF